MLRYRRVDLPGTTRGCGAGVRYYTVRSVLVGSLEERKEKKKDLLTLKYNGRYAINLVLDRKDVPPPPVFFSFFICRHLFFSCGRARRGAGMSAPIRVKKEGSSGRFSAKSDALSLR